MRNEDVSQPETQSEVASLYKEMMRLVTRNLFIYRAVHDNDICTSSYERICVFEGMLELWIEGDRHLRSLGDTNEEANEPEKIPETTHDILIKTRDVLKNCAISNIKLFWNAYSKGHIKVNKWHRLLEVTFDDHMFYFPTELGRVFHASHFQDLCSLFGADKVEQMVHKNVQRHIRGNTISLQELVVEAATNDEISLDAVYILIRMDPAEAFVPSTNVGARNRKRNSNQEAAASIISFECSGVT